MCEWKRISLLSHYIMFSYHRAIFVCNYLHAPVCASSHKLSQIICIFSSPTQMWEAYLKAHKWISSRVTTAPCFPTVKHLGTVALLSNLDELCSGLKHQRVARHSSTHCCIIKGEILASVALSHQYRNPCKPPVLD